MSDRVVYKGKIYGNTLATQMATVIQEPDEIDSDGTYLYIVPDEDELSIVEIKGGGRVKYGMGGLGTVIVQGVKMTIIPNYVEPSSDNGRSNYGEQLFKQGALLPTDLYTSFNLKTGFLVANAGYTQKVLPEEFSLKAIRRNGNNLIYIIETSDSEFAYKDGEETKYSTPVRYSERDTLNRKDFFIDAAYNFSNHTFLDLYNVPSAQNTLYTYADYDSQTLGTSIPNTADYSGIYFTVATVEDSHNPVYGYNSKAGADDKKYNKEYKNGYVWYIPWLINLKETYNSLKFNLRQLTKNEQGKYIVDFSDVTSWSNSNNRIVKYNNKYYIKNDLTGNIWKEFTPLYYMGELSYWGKSSTDPITVGVTLDNQTETAVDVEELLIDMFDGYAEFSIAEDDINVIKIIKNGNLSLNCYNSLNGNTIPVHIIKSSTNEYVTYFLLKSSDFTMATYVPSFSVVYKPQVFLAPFANEAEKNFALGIREDLQYLDQATYEVYKFAQQIISTKDISYYEECLPKYRGQLRALLIKQYAQYVSYNSFQYNDIVNGIDSTFNTDVDDAIVATLKDKVANTGTTIDDINAMTNIPNKIKERVAE